MENTHKIICIDNSGYEASLERGKLYQLIPDDEAAKHHQLRVTDESGEDYLYPESCFRTVVLPETKETATL